jgi:hypothetical protein
LALTTTGLCDPAPAEIVACIVARRAQEQAAETQRGAQSAITPPEAETTNLPPWPIQHRDRLLALRSSLAAAPGTPAEIARRFTRATPSCRRARTGPRR